MPVGKFVNVTEAAAILGCTTGRVRQMLGKDIITGIKANARAWLIPVKELEKVKDTTGRTGRPRTCERK